MSIRLIVKSAGNGPRIRLNGAKRPDFYVFTRDPKRYDLHVLEFPDAAAFNAVSEDLMRAPGNPPFHIEITPEVAEADGKAAEALKTAKADLATAETVNEELRREIAQVRQAAEAALEARPSDNPETVEFLKERDDLLDTLQPFVVGEETPVQCLARLLEGKGPAPAPAPATAFTAAAETAPPTEHKPKEAKRKAGGGK